MSDVVIAGDTSGSITLRSPAVSGSSVLTLPVATDTLVGKATTDTLTNKTLTSPTLTTPALGTPASGILTSCTGLNYNGFKNRVINGAMVIDQRNAGASVTPTSTRYLLDRWYGDLTQSSKYSVQQNAGAITPPAGFINYLGATSLSSYSVLAGDYFILAQLIEGLNVSDLAWGTASAATVTLSFWVRSSLTGTFGGSFLNSANNRSYAFTYAISVANTWEQKSITIAGDTSGTWLTTNGIGIKVIFSLGTGSTYSGTAGAWGSSLLLSATGAVSVVGTNGATFYITGVQFETGSTATSFDYRPYSTELSLCLAYYWRWTAGTIYSAIGVGGVGSATVADIIIKLPQRMRAIPTFNYSNMRLYDQAATPAVTSIVGSYNSLDSMTVVLAASGGGLTAGRAVILQANNNVAAYIEATAEL